MALVARLVRRDDVKRTDEPVQRNESDFPSLSRGHSCISSYWLMILIMSVKLSVCSCVSKAELTNIAMLKCGKHEWVRPDGVNMFCWSLWILHILSLWMFLSRAFNDSYILHLKWITATFGYWSILFLSLSGQIIDRICFE